MALMRDSDSAGGTLGVEMLEFFNLVSAGGYARGSCFRALGGGFTDPRVDRFYGDRDLGGAAPLNSAKTRETRLNSCRRRIVQPRRTRRQPRGSPKTAKSHRRQRATKKRRSTTSSCRGL